MADEWVTLLKTRTKLYLREIDEILGYQHDTFDKLPFDFREKYGVEI